MSTDAGEGRDNGMLRSGVVVIGAQDMDRAERFWCSALGYEERYRQDGGDWRELQAKVFKLLIGHI